LHFYRYVGSQAEAEQIARERRIQSNSASGTWWTTDRYDDPEVARFALSLNNFPLFRVGPIDSAMMPPFDVVELRPVAAWADRAGGGVEGCTSFPVLLFGLYEYASTGYVALESV
jgi:hypothetical protein